LSFMSRTHKKKNVLDDEYKQLNKKKIRNTSNQVAKTVSFLHN
jgi:hypothetical protein